MKIDRCAALALLLSCTLLITACSHPAAPKQSAGEVQQASLNLFKVDSADAGSIRGTVTYAGKRPARQKIDMSEEPACVEAHHGPAYDESLVVGPHDGLAHVFIYVKHGLEGKQFAVPNTPVTIDQSGCWFRPRVLGIQVNQILKVINSDPVTHNIHPMAEINRDWNHSQEAGDAPINRKFIKPEVMIKVKCNIHSWMHAYIGVVGNPYFAVTKADGSFTIPNLPAGTYTLGIWQEKLGSQEQQVTVDPQKTSVIHIKFKGR